MKVSIITVTYNSEAHIADCIKSVDSQWYDDIEHIIIDGASNDNTIKTIMGMPNRVNRIISEPDRGIYDAMNKGINCATGDVIGILNSDDFFTSNDVINSIVNEFASDSTLEGIFTDLYYVSRNNPDRIVRYWVSSSFKKGGFFKGWHPPHPTLYLKREVYEKYGNFNLNFSLAADTELMLRFFEKHNIRTKYLPITTVKMRLGGTSNNYLKNLRKQNLQCINAFRVNGFKPPLLYPIYRLLPKLLQFFLKRS